MLVRGFSLPVAQLFVIAIENILPGGGADNLTRNRKCGFMCHVYQFLDRYRAYKP